MEIIELDTKDMKLRVSVRPDKASRRGEANPNINWGTYKVIKMDVDDLINKMNNPEITTADGGRISTCQ